MAYKLEQGNLTLQVKKAFDVDRKILNSNRLNAGSVINNVVEIVVNYVVTINKF